MAIGSRVPGRSVIAGQYGIISAEAQPVVISQEVRLVDPAATLITLSQSVQQIDRARQMVVVQQRVLGAGVAPFEVTPPAAYVIINGVDVTSMTARDTVRITFNEDQAATAAVFLFVEMGAAVNIPSFHGKSIRIETHTDPTDINSEIIPLFTGWIETARHDRQRMGIEFRATDLRDERLGREDGQALKSITGGLYSTVTQREDVSGREYVTELMKTVSGSLGYTRSGDLRYHSWGVGSKPINLTLGDADVAYDDLTTEFQTRSSVVNSVTIDFDYRYYALRQFYTSVNLDITGPQKRDLGGTFSAESQVSKATGYSPWKTLSYSIYPAVRVYINYFLGRFTETPVVVPGKSDGHFANLVRLVAQPVTESYRVRIVAPQSVDAYGEEVESSSLTFAYDSGYEPDQWEESFSLQENAGDSPLLMKTRYSGYDARNEVYRWWVPGGMYSSSNLQSAIISEKQKAIGSQFDLNNAWNCAVRIAKKEIVSSHRNNYVEAKLRRIEPINVGDIVQHDNRIVQTIGQCVGVEYTIADGIRETSIRAAISYMDTEIQPPVENLALPVIEYINTDPETLTTTVEYVSGEGFETTLPDIDLTKVDERRNENELTVDISLESNAITLINGH